MVRLALYSGNLLSELRQNAIVPQLLARDPTLISALASGDYSQSTQRLISFNEEISAASLTLLDRDGRVVASTDRQTLGQTYREGPGVRRGAEIERQHFQYLAGRRSAFSAFSIPEGWKRSRGWRA